MAKVYVDVDIDEIYNNCYEREKHLLVELLYKDGYITEYENVYTKPDSVLREMFNEDINKILENYLQLSQEEIDLISKIAKKY